MTMRGRTHMVRLCAFLMKCASIFSVMSKSAMTPSFIGLMATMLPGVRPSISLASLPTASMRPFTLLIATIDGSFTTIPLPRAYTQVFAVPRSIARSLEKREKRERRLNDYSLIADCGMAIADFLIVDWRLRLLIDDGDCLNGDFGATSQSTID